MTSEREIGRPARELRLEGIGLAFIGGLLLAVMVGAFFIGRWYERQMHPAVTAAESTDPLGLANSPGEQEAIDLDSDATYFDTVAGPEQEFEPSRETARQREPSRVDQESDSPRRAAPPESGSLPAASTAGSFYVQVFAGRDESSAAGLVRKLSAEGYAVKLHTEKQGQADLLYKVRVGGFETQEDARLTAQELKKGGYPGAWVTRID